MMWKRLIPGKGRFDWSDDSETDALAASSEDAASPVGPTAVERRLRRSLPAVSAALIALAGVRGGGRLAVAVALGAALAHVNYFWLRASLKNLLATVKGRPSRAQMSKFFLRWIVIAGTLVFAAQVADLSAIAIVCGLFALPLAVLVEPFFQIYYAVVGKKAGISSSS
jgi:hypothetical protein